MSDDKPYVLGHTGHEIRRLELQAGFLAPPTRRLLEAAGLATGMSVLDIGTGAGDVAMAAAAIVGSEGAVVGIDRSEASLERAGARIRAAGLGHVRFDAVDLLEADALGRFDLVVGRFVLLFQLDKPAFLRKAAALVKPGGTLAFLEPMANEQDRYSTPSAPLHDWTLSRIVKGFGIGKADAGVGGRLSALFQEAGLQEPHLFVELPGGGPSSQMPEWVSATLESLSPALKAAGELEDLDFSEHTRKLGAEAIATQSQLYGPHVVGAWVRVGERDFEQGCLIVNY